eukprot:gene8378-10198_t
MNSQSNKVKRCSFVAVVPPYGPHRISFSREENFRIVHTMNVNDFTNGHKTESCESDTKYLCALQHSYRLLLLDMVVFELGLPS